MKHDDCKFDCDWKEVGFHLIEEIKGLKAQVLSLTTEMKAIYKHFDERLQRERDHSAEERRRLFDRTDTLKERAAVTETKLWFIVAAATGVGSIIGGLIVQHFGG